MSTPNSAKPQPIPKNEKALKFLQEHPTAVLATVDADGYPHATVIYYSVDNDFIVRFTTKNKTKKSDDIEHNNHAMLVVYDAATQTVVQVRGWVLPVTDTGEANETFRGTLQASLKTSSTGIPPISKLSAGGYVAYKIEPVDIHMAVYSETIESDYRRIFEEVELPA